MNTSIFGLALGQKFMKTADQVDYNGYAKGELWESLYSPCSNCKVLLQKSGAPHTQFAWNFEKTKAPKGKGPPTPKSFKM